jgi:hypothetical protein
MKNGVGAESIWDDIESELAQAAPARGELGQAIKVVQRPQRTIRSEAGRRKAAVTTPGPGPLAGYPIRPDRPGAPP